MRAIDVDQLAAELDSLIEEVIGGARFLIIRDGVPCAWLIPYGEVAGRSTAARHIVLVGLMGTGKTTVAILLAERLGRRRDDSDELIEERTGRTVREIFATDGEPAFRTLETDALAEALAAEGRVGDRRSRRSGARRGQPTRVAIVQLVRRLATSCPDDPRPASGRSGPPPVAR